MTTVSDGLFQYGGMPVGYGIPPFVSKDSKVFFVDPVNGLDGNPGNAKLPFQTLYKAHKMCTAGNNDVVFLISNGALSGAAVLTAALAAAADSTLTTGVLTWSKNATHLIGVCSGGNNQRAKIATVYDRDGTTYTVTTFGSSTQFVNVTASGCYFKNISAQALFSTGGASMVCWTDAGSRNVYDNCGFYGQMDTASAQGTGSRSLKVGSSGSGENMFIRCQIGQDTVTRTVANANLELAGGTPRNTFYKCLFPIYGSGGGQFAVLGTGASCIDRWTLFDQCEFINNVGSGSANLTAMMSLTNASPGGILRLKQCGLVGATKWGDTNALAFSYVDNVGGAATDGLSLNPS